MADPLSVACPQCKAAAEWPCRTVAIVRYRHGRKPHAARIRAADREREKDAALRGEVKHG